MAFQLDPLSIARTARPDVSLRCRALGPQALETAATPPMFPRNKALLRSGPYNLFGEA